MTRLLPPAPLLLALLTLLALRAVPAWAPPQQPVYMGDVVDVCGDV